MLRLKKAVLHHSPIASKPRNACIDLDNFTLSMIPELPWRSSPEDDFEPMFPQEETQEQIFPMTSDANNIFLNNMSDDHDCNTNHNLQCVSFDEPTNDSAITGDSISNYQDSDIELMREGLSVFLDDPTTAEEEKKINSSVGGETLIEPHPLILPQVTFDEEEVVFDRRTFFDQPKQERKRKHDEPTPMISCRQYNEPSDWLRQQISSNDFSFQVTTPKCGNARTADIRASLETKHKHWSPDEDGILKLAVETTELMHPIDWIQIAQDWFNNSRSATQCKNRWKNYLKPGVVRGNWQKHEDQCIVSMVSRGFKWVDIAKGLPGRTGEHVRERYVNVLDNKLKRTCWTAEEDRILFEHQRIWGNKWSEIRKLLPGRSDNSIKNRFHNRRNAHLRRLKRESSKKNGGKS